MIFFKQIIYIYIYLEIITLKIRTRGTIFKQKVGILRRNLASVIDREENVVRKPALKQIRTQAGRHAAPGSSLLADLRAVLYTWKMKK